jgi:hypothetical protein
MAKNRWDRDTVELPPSERVIPLGMEERRKEERSAFTNLRQWLLEIVDGHGSDSEKLNAVKMILVNVDKNNASQF